jgi:hypothetical protein
VTQGKTTDAALDVAGIALEPVDFFRLLFSLAEVYSELGKEVDAAISSPEVTREFGAAVWGGGGSF